MSLLPEHLKYAPSHEWAQLEMSFVRVGITDFAQEELGDLVFVELPEIGQKVTAGDSCATIESVKTASDIHSPVSGEVIEINQSVVDAPEKINDSAYEAWLFCVRADDLTEVDALLSPSAYETMITA